VLALALAGSLLLASCAGLGPMLQGVEIRKPRVALDELEITDLDLQAIGLNLVLAVDNPNPVPVQLNGFDYTVFVEDRQLTAGEQRQGVDIAARGKSSVPVPVQVRFGDLAELARELADATTFAYRVEATARVAVPVLGELSLPAQTSGTLPLPRLPVIRVDEVRIAHLGLAGADLVVALAVRNPNAFGLDITGLAYQLEVGGTSWLQSELPQPLNLGEGGASRVDIPVHLKLGDLRSLAAKALTGGEPLAYRLHGTVAFDTSLPQLRGVSLPFDNRGTAPTLR
jgi:LEA14-like dessication related protein